MWTLLRSVGSAPPMLAPWRQAVRMTVAAVLAYSCTRLFGLPEGYWSVITCLVVVQGSLGGTLEAGISRLYGTILGALFGGAGAWAQTRTPVPQVAILLAVVLPTSLLAAARPKFRLAPITAGMILLVTAREGAPLAMALNRVTEIAIGSMIGVLAAILILPGRGAAALRQHGAATLLALGEQARSHLTGREDAERSMERIRAAIDKAQTACAETMRERALHLAGGPPPEPLMRTLRRLRTDVALLGRAMSVGPAGQGSDRLAHVLHDWFGAAGHALRTGNLAPDLAAIDEASAAVAPETMLGFALLVLRRDLEDLQERLAEHAARRAAHGIRDSGGNIMIGIDIGIDR